MDGNPNQYPTRVSSGPLSIQYVLDLLLTTDNVDVCNFIDDNMLYECCKSLEETKSLIKSQ